MRSPVPKEQTSLSLHVTQLCRKRGLSKPSLVKACSGCKRVGVQLGMLEQGVLLSLAVGVGTPLGIFVLAIFPPSQLQSTPMPKDGEGGKLERPCPCNSLGVGFLQNKLHRGSGPHIGSAEPLPCSQV